MTTRSMADIAYDILKRKKRAVQFIKMWDEVAKTSGYGNDHVAQFYSDLTFDPRFVCLKDNKWDLVERRKFDESHIDISKIELEDDEPEESDEDNEIIPDPENEYDS